MAGLKAAVTGSQPGTAEGGAGDPQGAAGAAVDSMREAGQVRRAWGRRGETWGHTMLPAQAALTQTTATTYHWHCHLPIHPAVPETPQKAAATVKQHTS
jgi:hypothetical protein